MIARKQSLFIFQLRPRSKRPVRPSFRNQGGVAYSHLNCAESFALANNNYVYNSQYERDYHPLQYQWLKDHIYQGHEYPTP